MSNLNKNQILGITIPIESNNDILEKIIKYIRNPRCFFHIVSLNPENIMLAQMNGLFKKTIETAQIKIVDGIGVVLAGYLYNFKLRRLTGTDLMEDLINLADNMRLRVLLIGGKPNLADKLVKCYKEKYTEAKFFGLEGIEDISKPKKSEEKRIFSIVADYKPHMIFVSFGSPDQELWLARHNKKLLGIVCMGVGGAFDYFSGRILRAPGFVQFFGFEWLFRLIRQPWRWKRQLRLLKFIWLVVKERLGR